MKNLFAKVSRNPISLAGVVITTISAIIFLTLFAIELVGFSGGPYMGIMAFLIVPAFFVGGLVLIPFGIWRARRKAKLAAEKGEEPESFDFTNQLAPDPMWHSTHFTRACGERW